MLIPSLTRSHTKPRTIHVQLEQEGYILIELEGVIIVKEGTNLKDHSVSSSIQNRFVFSTYAAFTVN